MITIKRKNKDAIMSNFKKKSFSVIIKNVFFDDKKNVSISTDISDNKKTKDFIFRINDLWSVIFKAGLYNYIMNNGLTKCKLNIMQTEKDIFNIISIEKNEKKQIKKTNKAKLITSNPELTVDTITSEEVDACLKDLED